MLKLLFGIWQATAWESFFLSLYAILHTMHQGEETEKKLR